MSLSFTRREILKKFFFVVLLRLFELFRKNLYFFLTVFVDFGSNCCHSPSYTVVHMLGTPCLYWSASKSSLVAQHMLTGPYCGVALI